MRNVVIVVAAIAGLVVVGLGIKMVWDRVGGEGNGVPNQTTAAGMPAGPVRDAFIADGAVSCEAKRPDTVPADTFKQYCLCTMSKAADFVTFDEARALAAGASIPQDLVAKMSETIKQCRKTAGLPDIVDNPAASSAMQSGKMEGPFRDAFIKSSVNACLTKRPDSIDADKFRQACVCFSEKAADMMTPDEVKEVGQTGAVPDSLQQRLNGPIKDCMRSAGLVPAQ